MNWERDVRFHRLMRDSSPSPYRALRFWRGLAVVALCGVGLLGFVLIVFILSR